jgi:hypothetical protein
MGFVQYMRQIRVISPLFQKEHPQKNQPQSGCTAPEPALKGISHHQSDPEAQAAATLHYFLSAHKNTPCTLYAEGVWL